ncbi:hypothetical protein [Kitasatospora purpeofusca]|uniref:hypothetical protein n=1 Tax=Kitasatospora purpeofusca TaxID=67352 RepID=UPI0035E07310
MERKRPAVRPIRSSGNPSERRIENRSTLQDLQEMKGVAHGRETVAGPDRGRGRRTPAVARAGPRWIGPRGEFLTRMPDRAFDWCWTTGSTDSRLLGMKKVLVPVSSINHTINVIGP